MLAVIFEAEARPGHQQDYPELAIERFRGLNNPNELLSLSFWQDAASIAAWRQREVHRHAQAAGRRVRHPDQEQAHEHA
jgi:heme-degrading monooxygenase HmoA